MQSVVVVAAKSTSDAYDGRPFPPDPNSAESTISTVEREIKEAGGEATAVVVDTRDFECVLKVINKTIEVYIFRLSLLFIYFLLASSSHRRC